MAYISLVVTIKQKPIVVYKREIKSNQIYPCKNHQVTKKDSKRERKEQLISQKKNKQNGNTKTFHINNYIKCRWIKFSNKKT